MTAQQWLIIQLPELYLQNVSELRFFDLSGITLL